MKRRRKRNLVNDNNETSRKIVFEGVEGGGEWALTNCVMSSSAKRRTFARAHCIDRAIP